MDNSFAKPWRGKIFLASFFSIMNKIFDIAPEILIGIYVDLVVQKEKKFQFNYSYKAYKCLA